MEEHEEGTQQPKETSGVHLSEFSDEVKKSYYYFYEQLIARGLGHDEPGYRLFMSITRRVILFPDENNQTKLNSNLEKFVCGLGYARLDRQKDLLKILLRLLPPYYQSQVIKIILSYEGSVHSETFIRDQSLGGLLATAITEMEGNYYAYIDDALELQKLVEQNLDAFKNGLTEEIIKKLIQRMEKVLKTITSSVDLVSPLIKIMCKNIVQVSKSENEGISRMAGFFINRYLGGLILKRNEAVFSKTSTGELIGTGIRTYILKFLQSLATTTEPEKLAKITSPFIETLTNANRYKLVIFLKSLSQLNLIIEQPLKLQINYDWTKLSRLEHDIAFKARYSAIYSLFNQLTLTQYQSPQKRDSLDKLPTPRKSLSIKRSTSVTNANMSVIQHLVTTNAADFLKGLSILELLNELCIFTKRNKDKNHANHLYNAIYDLCMDFIAYYLIKLCRQPKSTTGEVQRGMWSPRVSHADDFKKIEGSREIILSNIDMYLSYIAPKGQMRLGITCLLHKMNQVNIQETNGPTYKKLCESLMEIAFITEGDSKAKTFERLIACVNDWIAAQPDTQKDVIGKSTLLGEFLAREHLDIEAFTALFIQENEHAAYGGASVITEVL